MKELPLFKSAQSKSRKNARRNEAASARGAGKVQKKSSSLRGVGRPKKYSDQTFGGARCATYNPRDPRPLPTKQALHLVLRARGNVKMTVPHLEGRVWEIIKKHADKNGIRIYEYANAGNHLHLLIRIRRRDFYCRFIRSITGLIARAVKGGERGRPTKGPFWEGRPFTRIVSFAGEQFKKVKLYLARNRVEALGFLKYQPRSLSGSDEWKRFWAMYVSVP